MCKGLGLAGVAQLVGHCPIKTQKGHRFDPGSGCVLSLWVWSWSEPVQDTTDQCFSFTSMFRSLSFFLLFHVSKNKKKSKLNL